jgi:hypothetical protein
MAIKTIIKLLFVCFVIVVANILFINISYAVYVNKLHRFYQLDILPLKTNSIKDFVFINDNTMLICTDIFELIKLDSITGESETITIDTGELKLHPKKMYYVYPENKILIHFFENMPHPYKKESLYFVYLDNYKMEEIFTINETITRVYYNSSEGKIYLNISGKGIDVFDIAKHQFVESVVFPKNVCVEFLDTLNGDRFQVLATCIVGEAVCYYLWDYYSKTNTIFTGINLRSGNFSGLRDFIQLDNSRFLCIEDDYVYKRKVMEVDLSTGKITSLISLIKEMPLIGITRPNFYWDVNLLKKCPNQKYGFILYLDNKRSLLCFFDYPTISTYSNRKDPPALFLLF